MGSLLVRHMVTRTPVRIFVNPANGCYYLYVLRMLEFVAEHDSSSDGSDGKQNMRTEAEFCT